MNHIFDTHAHYSSRQFDADRAALLKALPEGGVAGVLECAPHSGAAARVVLRPVANHFIYHQLRRSDGKQLYRWYGGTQSATACFPL